MFRDSSVKAPRAAVTPVQRRTITEEVLVRLRELLFRGELKPGARIDQAELASNFGVSTVPVREALLRLQSAGLVEVVSHRGVFVSEVSVEELLDIYTTRELLEEQAARLSVQNLTSGDLASLEEIAAGMQAAAAKQRLDDLLTLNREFHFTIYRASHRRHLLQLIEQLWDLSTRYAHLQLHAVPDRAAEALYEIRSIVAACKRKDTDAVGLMIRYKVHQTTVGLLQHMSLPGAGESRSAAAGKAEAEAKAKTRTKAGSKAKAKPKTAPKAAAKRLAPKAKATVRTPSKTKAGSKAKATKAPSKTKAPSRTKARVQGKRGT